MYQAPIPTDFWTWLFDNSAWNDFPTVFLIACFMIGIFVAGRWFWADYKKEAEKERQWRETQNEGREKAQDVRDEKMIAFFKAISAGTAEDISDMRAASERITKALDALLINYGSHDLQAKEIRGLVYEIRTELVKLTQIKQDQK